MSVNGSFPNSRWLIGQGKMTAAIAAYPWGETSLGPLNEWPPHLRTAVNIMLCAGAPMAVVWGPDFRFLYNDLYADLIHEKHPTALGNPAAVIFPEVWESVLPLFQQASSGNAVLIDDYELTLVRQGRLSRGYFSFSYNPITSETGTVGGFLAVVVETTIRVEREQTRASVFETVLSSITDFAYTFDLSGRFTYVNKALLNLWGLPLESALGKNFFDLAYPEALAARLQTQIQQVIDEKITIRDETRYESATGVDSYYEYIFSPVLGLNGLVNAVAGLTRDVSARHETQTAALKISKAKDDFLAALSHELRAPLNPVLLVATEAAQNTNLSTEVAADFKMIAQNIALEVRLIDDLLDLSHITHGKLTMDFKPQAVNSLLDRVLESVASDAKGKQITLTATLSASRDVVMGDELRLFQILSNLVRNALKFTPVGGRVSVLTRNDTAGADTLVIEITDTGLGLTPAELENAFTAFSQGEHVNSTRGQFGGLGLGLTISRKLAELHSGQVSVRSPGRNQGATFTLELPLKVGDPKSPNPVADPVKSRSGSTGNLRGCILLVEDHETSRRVLARVLKLRGFQVVEAATAEEALLLARVNTFNFVICDIGLPDTDGYRLMKSLKTIYGCVGIALTGYGGGEDVAKSKEAGFLIHLTKPVSSTALDEALDQMVRPAF